MTDLTKKTSISLGLVILLVAVLLGAIASYYSLRNRVSLLEYKVEESTKQIVKIYDKLFPEIATK